MGHAQRDRPGRGDDRLDGAAGRRGCAGGTRLASDRDSQPGRGHRDRRWPRVHRRHQRRTPARLRRGHRTRAVGRPARGQRPRHPHDLSRPQRPADRGDRRRRRRLPQPHDIGRRGRLRAAGAVSAETRILTLGVVAGLWLARPSEGFQDPHGQPITHAARATVPISVDGRLGEDEWSRAPVAAGFVQREPNEGAAATEATELRLLYDDAALYVGVRLHDSEPGRIVRQLSRRDDVAEADSFSIFLDPHHDHLTGVEFQVSAAGVQRDAVIYDDNFESDAWDAVWQSAVTVDAQGWVVEMRIPFSQLRFPATFRPTWGVNARRIVRRKSEVSWLALVPSSESGLASRMAHLEGIRGIPPARHLELLPYASVREEYIAPARPGNPFNDGSRPFGGVGLDVKYGLTSNMTMAAAINPDFGQVEVDPAVVNLTAYETFFDEKRPFFTEGAQVFSHFARSGASDYTTFFYPEPQLFYSRRIGRAPQGRAVGDYVDTPASTTILGAAKLTGRTSGGWTVGVVEAVTGRESARISNGLLSSRVEVEPLTNYFVGRAERELGPRAGVGVLATAVDRSLGPSWTGTSCSTPVAGGCCWAASPAAPSPGARPRSCACRRARSATTSGRTPPTCASIPRRRPCPDGVGGSPSTRTAATSPPTRGSGGSARASSPTTPASPPRPIGAAATGSCSGGSSSRTAGRARARSGWRSGGPSITAASRRATACSPPSTCSS
ncbi:MAG: hypothetical protein DMF77_25250 [Acidobacteria bacterium]|nr:MAG: hypothetical protein DMF77_25250 [Acidobacteriota bacterium]